MRQPSRVVETLLTLLLVFTGSPALNAQEEPPSPAGTTERATWSIEVTPFVGAFVPLADLFEFSATGLILGVPVRLTRAGRQSSAIAVGGRISGWFSERLGIEGTFTYMPASDLELRQTIEIPTEPDRVLDFTPSAAVWIAAARLLYRLARIDRSAAILIGVGPAVISRSGSAYRARAFNQPSGGAVGGTTDLGGAFDLGVRIDASSRIAIRLDAEAYLYSASLSVADPIFTGGDPPSSSKFQTDVVLSAGLAIGL